MGGRGQDCAGKDHLLPWLYGWWKDTTYAILHHLYAALEEVAKKWLRTSKIKTGCEQDIIEAEKRSFRRCCSKEKEVHAKKSCRNETSKEKTCWSDSIWDVNTFSKTRWLWFPSFKEMEWQRQIKSNALKSLEFFPEIDNAGKKKKILEKLNMRRIGL